MNAKDWCRPVDGEHTLITRASHLLTIAKPSKTWYHARPLANLAHVASPDLQGCLPILSSLSNNDSIYGTTMSRQSRIHGLLPRN